MVGIQLDRFTYKSGSELTGRVFLSVSDSAEGIPISSTGVTLAIVGEEYYGIVRGEQFQNPQTKAPVNGVDEVTKAPVNEVDEVTKAPVNEVDEVHPFLRIEVPLTAFQSKCIPSTGQYEYPFQWTIPALLPSSMACQYINVHCGIRYKITAFLNQPAARHISEYTATQFFKISAEGQHKAATTGIVVVEPEYIPVHVCCFNKGSMMLGFDISSTNVSPNSTLEVGIIGTNSSSVDVHYLKAELFEAVEWGSANQSNGYNKYTMRRLLAESNFGPNEHWAPIINTPRLSYMDQVQVTEETVGRVHGVLRLPSDARDTYQGSFIVVSHSLVVTAVTSGACFVTSPSTFIPVRMGRQEASIDDDDTVGLHQGAPIGGNLCELQDDPPMESAQFLPAGWSPHEADVVFIPASTVSLEGDYSLVELTPTALDPL